MKKLLVVARREYRETVRKKTFLIVTALMPLLMASLMFVPSMLITRTGGERSVLFLDATHRLGAALEGAATTFAEPSRKSPAMGELSFKVEVRQVDDLEGAAREERAALAGDTKWSAIVAVPAGVLDGSEEATYYSRSSTDLIIRERTRSTLSRAVTELRAATLGLSSEATGKLLDRVQMGAVQITREGTTKRGGEMDFLVAFVFAIMLLMPTLLQSQEILRGVVQEKSERIVESLVSSMTAFQLLTGKVVGLALVGLTQIVVWSIMAFLISSGAAATLVAMGINLLDFVTPAKLLWFALFYLLGYLTNACIFATAGACANSEKEAQQILQPMMIVLMVPWILMMPIVTEPDGRLATVFSMLPLFCPLPMFVRILVGSPPSWQIAASIASALASILFLFWLAARIFRVGILWYGKRPSLPEFLRWVRMP